MTVFVPNSFKSDGDLLIDTFGPVGAFINPEGYFMQVFTRWGEEIFSTHDPYKQWDGRIKGTSEIASVDVYLYFIRLQDLKGSWKECKGYVTLLKKE